jgi:hypothetical protein
VQGEDAIVFPCFIGSKVQIFLNFKIENRKVRSFIFCGVLFVKVVVQTAQMHCLGGVFGGRGSSGLEGRAAKVKKTRRVCFSAELKNPRGWVAPTRCPCGQGSVFLAGVTFMKVL